MAKFQFPVRRLIIAGGFALAVAAAPAIAVFAVPTAGTPVPVAQCPGGEEADQFTGVCVPHTVPNSDVFSPILGNPTIPAIGGIPCVGRHQGECIGLAEEEAAMGPQPVPRSTISSSP
jgi:hypothetical protein